MKSWHKQKIKREKANITSLGNKGLPRFFRKISNATTDEKTDILEYHYTDTKVQCLPLNLI